MPIEPSEIDQKTSASYGYGHGGKLGENVPLIGLNHVTELKLVDKDDMSKYNCGICDVTFTFEHRSKHLTGMDHRSKYLVCPKIYIIKHLNISDLYDFLFSVVDFVRMK